jgi:hypothetical protein
VLIPFIVSRPQDDFDFETRKWARNDKRSFRSTIRENPLPTGLLSD